MFYEGVEKLLSIVLTLIAVYGAFFGVCWLLWSNWFQPIFRVLFTLTLFGSLLTVVTLSCTGFFGVYYSHEMMALSLALLFVTITITSAAVVVTYR